MFDIIQCSEPNWLFHVSVQSVYFKCYRGSKYKFPIFCDYQEGNLVIFIVLESIKICSVCNLPGVGNYWDSHLWSQSTEAGANFQSIQAQPHFRGENNGQIEMLGLLTYPKQTFKVGEEKNGYPSTACSVISRNVKIMFCGHPLNYLSLHTWLYSMIITS